MFWEVPREIIVVSLTLLRMWNSKDRSLTSDGSYSWRI